MFCVTRDRYCKLQGLGIFDPGGSHRGLVVSAVDCEPTARRVASQKLTTLTFSPVVHDWVNKDLGMSSRVCATGHIIYPVPLIEKGRALCPRGRFLPSFIHQVIITGQNNISY